jgi:hypothetical protein
LKILPCSVPPTTTHNNMSSCSKLLLGGSNVAFSTHWTFICVTLVFRIVHLIRQDFQTLSIICLIIIFPEQSIFLIATILTTWTCSGHGNNWNTVHMTLNYNLGDCQYHRFRRDVVRYFCFPYVIRSRI